MTAPLFDVPDPDPDRKPQACDQCLMLTEASDDGLRVRGWVAYNGTSWTGRRLRVRICPACQVKGARR